METEDLVKEKIELEKSICARLNDIEKRYGVLVSGVNLYHIGTEHGTVFTNDVKLDIRL